MSQRKTTMILKGKCIEPKRTSVVLFMQRGINTQIDNIRAGYNQTYMKELK